METFMRTEVLGSHACSHAAMCPSWDLAVNLPPLKPGPFCTCLRSIGAFDFVDTLAGKASLGMFSLEEASLETPSPVTTTLGDQQVISLGMLSPRITSLGDQQIVSQDASKSNPCF